MSQKIIKHIKGMAQNGRATGLCSEIADAVGGVSSEDVRQAIIDNFNNPYLESLGFDWKFSVSV